MADETMITCPLTPEGFCLYEGCVYWDAGQERCTACFQEAPGPPDLPCVIHWLEDDD